ncbi:MAG: hypothetical protein GXO35_08525 [Gammaproteobacteria bacterium]|nr:hypothetical protein [Gammaproteobacteria bacterium]
MIGLGKIAAGGSAGFSFTDGSNRTVGGVLAKVLPLGTSANDSACLGSIANCTGVLGSDFPLGISGNIDARRGDIVNVPDAAGCCGVKLPDFSGVFTAVLEDIPLGDLGKDPSEELPESRCNANGWGSDGLLRGLVMAVLERPFWGPKPYLVIIDGS